MTRRKIGVALLGAMGIAKAQNKEQDTPGLVVGWPPPTGVGGGVMGGGCLGADGFGAPCNSPETKDACPLCGTKAEAFVRPTDDMYASCVPAPSSSDTTLAVCVGPTGKRVGPMERVTRCKRCNNAFWQDATE